MKTSALERFLRYVRIDTRADESVPTSPSTPGQLVLMRLLESELRGLGLQDVVLDEHGYLMATIPATVSRTDVPTIGFIAHVDTSPEMPGAPSRHLPFFVFLGVRVVDNPDIFYPD